MNLKRAREAKRLTQMALADKLGLSVRTILRCEAAGVLPQNRLVARQYRRVLGLPRSE